MALADKLDTAVRALGLMCLHEYFGEYETDDEKPAQWSEDDGIDEEHPPGEVPRFGAPFDPHKPGIPAFEACHGGVGVVTPQACPNVLRQWQWQWRRLGVVPGLLHTSPLAVREWYEG